MKECSNCKHYDDILNKCFKGDDDTCVKDLLAMDSINKTVLYIDNEEIPMWLIQSRREVS